MTTNIATWDPRLRQWVATPDLKSPTTTQTIIPPASSAIYWESLATWFGANYSTGVRFSIDTYRRPARARLPCTTASGKIEVTIDRVSGDGAGGLFGTQVATSGRIDCPAPSNGSITVPFPAGLELEPGQYVLSLWADNTTLVVLHNLSTGILRSGQALSYDIATTDGMPKCGSLAYSGRAVCIILEEDPVMTGRAVLLGDSITQQQKWMSVAMSLSGRMYSITNEGVPGESSSLIAARAQTDVVDPHPDLCVLVAGTNDISEVTPAASSIIANLSSTIDAIVDGGIEVVVGTIPPRFNSASRDQLSAVQRAAFLAVNDWIRALDRPGVKVVDWTGDLALADGIVPNTGYFADHVHPNTAGGFVMGQALAPVLAS